MPRDRLLFKYKGDGGEFLNRIPARDLYESDRHLLSDDDLLVLAESPLYEARNEADEQVARAERRVEKEATDAAASGAAGVTVAGADRPAKK